MSVWNSFLDVIELQPVGTNDASQAAGDAAEAALKAKNQQELQDGTITQAVYDQMTADLAKSDADQVGNIEGQSKQAFDQSIQDSVSGVTSGLTRPIGDILWGFIKGIPWWLWFIAAGVVFFMTPLPELIFGSAFSRAFSRKGKS